jgi:hypothetical protein
MKESIVIPEHLAPQFEKAKEELGEDVFNEKLDVKFGKPVLNFARSMVINLPGDCYANCWYCIDGSLRRQVTDSDTFITRCGEVFKEFPDMYEIAITGGSLPADKFNYLLSMIRSYYPDVKITWNTNGPNLNEDYLPGIEKINFINLHRNAVSEEENFEIFKSTVPIITIEEAKKLIGDKLFLRVTVDKDFNLSDWTDLGVPLYLNKLLPGNSETNKVYEDVLKQLQKDKETSKRRRNRYLNYQYNGTPVRVCVGDTEAKRVKGRYPVYLNVVIIHRNALVCGSWYLDDKLLIE